MENNYFRTNSICADPYEKLQQYVKNNDCDGIKHLINDNKGLFLLQHEYEQNNKTILEQACTDFANDVDKETIETLLALGADPLHANKKHQMKTALHFAALEQNPIILEILLNSSKNVNVTANGNNALHLMVKEVDANEQKPSFMECIRMLVKNGIDIRSGDKKNNTALYWAARNKHLNVVKYLLSLDARVTEKEADALRKLPKIPVFAIFDPAKKAFEYLRSKDQVGFVNKVTQDPQDNDDNDEESFLQYASANNLMEAASVLIAKDPNKVGKINKTKPIEIALRNGYHLLVERLLAANAHVPDGILNEALKRIDTDQFKHADFQRCVSLVINRKDVDVNAKDHNNGNYPLHYAAKYAGKKVVKQLLKQKASLANRDKFNYPAVNYIDHDTLKEHFDSCIEAHPDPNDKANKENMYLAFDYTTLLPTPIKLPETDCEMQELKNKNGQHQYRKECDVVLHISKDPEQKDLLLHPLIVSLLYLKWQRVRFLFNLNFFIYLVFCVSLLAFIWSNYEQPSKNNRGCFYLLLLTTIIITVREVFQMVLMTKKYFCSIDNYIEIALLGFVYVMLFWSSKDEHLVRQCYAFAVLLAALELLFLMGSVPELSTYIIMLRTVSYNFCKFFMFNAILILAFAFCFYTLFTKPKMVELEAKANAEDTENEDKDAYFFSNIFIALFKTLVMLTGEFEAGDLDFEQFPVTSHLIFIMFVVLIAIILLNLLNGLAVSDTQEIKNQAKLVALTARAEYISYVEALTFGHCYSWPSLENCCWGNSCFCCNRNANGMSRKLMSWVSISKVYLDDGFKMKVYPNQRGLVKSVGPVKKNIRLDEGTVKKAMTITSERHHNKENSESDFQQIEKLITNLFDAKFKEMQIKIEEGQKQNCCMIK